MTVIAEASAAVPHAPAAMSDTPAAMSDAPAAMPDAPAAMPNTPAAMPDTATAVPQAPAAVPQAPAAVPQAPAAVPQAPAAVPHTLADDVVGIVTGAFMASAGLFLLNAGGAVTGGTAGVGLLLGRLTGWPFAVLYVAVTLPFVVLAIARKGWRFAVRSGIAVGLLALFSLAHPHVLTVERINPVYAALAGNLAVGIGLLMLFRHGASLGGFNVVALVCQERLGWRAGYVQLALDGTVILLGCFVAPVPTVLISALGAVVMNLVIALNHRPGRYTA